MAFDPDEFLKQEAKNASVAAPAAATEPSGGFDPDAFLSNPANAQGSSAEPSMVAETAASSITPGTPMETPPEPNAAPQLPVSGYGPGVVSQLSQTGLGQTASAMAQPYGRAAQSLMGQYIASPLTKLAPDIASVASGMLPPIASSQMLQATQQAGTAAMRSRVPPPVMPTFQTTPPSAAQISNNPMLNEIAARNAALQSESLANRTIIQKIAMSKVMQLIAPSLNTAARVAGPAGLAYNTYEAGQMARETQLGERLAQGQGRTAQQSFRNMNVPYGSGFNQNITPDQARAVLASQSARDIEAFGGLDFLRKKALGQ